MHSARSTPVTAEGAAAFMTTSAITLLYALRGGTYDVLARHQAAMVIWLVLAVGLGVGVLPRERLPRSGIALLAALGALLAWTLAALAWTESAERTATEIGRVLHHTGVVALGLCLVTRGTWTAAAAGLVAGAAAVCLLSIGSRLFPELFPPDPIPAALGLDRLSYPLNYWNAVAAWAAMTAVMALAWSAHAESRTARALSLAAVPVAMLVVYLTYSRQGVVGLAIGVVVVLLAARRRGVAALHLVVAAAAGLLAVLAVRDQPDIAQGTGTAGRGWVLAALAVGVAVAVGVGGATSRLPAQRLGVSRRVARLLMGAAATAVVVAAAVAGPSLALDAWREFRGQRSDSAASADPAARLGTLGGNRYPVWASALRAWRTRPLEGRGPGTFGLWWSRDGTNAERLEDAHSLALEMLAELGLPGLLVTLTIMVAMLTAAALARRRAVSVGDAGAATALAAAVVVGLLHAQVDWVWEETADMFVVLLAATLLAATAGRGTPGRRLLPRLGTAIAAVLVCLGFVPGLVGVSEVRASARAVSRGDIDAAYLHADKAIDAQPWASSGYLQRALVSEAAAAYAHARADLKSAAKRSRTDWRPWLVLARVEAAAGRPRQALAADSKARRLVRFPP